VGTKCLVASSSCQPEPHCIFHNELHRDTAKITAENKNIAMSFSGDKRPQSCCKWLICENQILTDATWV